MASIYTPSRQCLVDLIYYIYLMCIVLYHIQTGSISTKTGDWDVHDKDICDIPAAPYIQERHFAGWSVENHSDQKKSHCVDKEKSNENKVSRKLFEKGETKSEQR